METSWGWKIHGGTPGSLWMQIWLTPNTFARPSGFLLYLGKGETKARIHAENISWDSGTCSSLYLTQAAVGDHTNR